LYVGIYSIFVTFKLEANDTKMNDDTFVQEIRTRIRDSIRTALEQQQGTTETKDAKIEIKDAKIDVDISTERPPIDPFSL
jgi:hypothetical protein